MRRRARIRHHQLELPRTRKPDKNGQFRGGARPGAGRKRKPRADGKLAEPHGRRLPVRASEPVHVILRVTAAVGSLRTHEMRMAVREASFAVARGRETSFHIVHYSIQRSHLHLIVEATDRRSLANGIRAFAISAAKHINAMASMLRGQRRRGAVFTDRYHAVILRAPRQVRACLAYVLNNWRHHGEARPRRGGGTRARAWKLDPYATGLAFDGWKERGEGVRYSIPAGYEGPLVWEPRSWLLRVGWRKHGMISVDEVPGRGPE